MGYSYADLLCVQQRLSTGLPSQGIGAGGAARAIRGSHALTNTPADQIALLVRRLLETEQQLRAMISGAAGRAETDSVQALTHESTHPAALACALLDADGVIVHASSAWRKQYALGGLFGTARETRVGANFLAVCDRVERGPSTAAFQLAAGIRSVLDGIVASFTLNLPGSATSTTRIDVFGLGAELRERVAVTLIDDSDEPATPGDSVDDSTRFRLTFEQAAVGIAHVAPAGGLVEVNDRFCEITGYSREELLLLGMSDLTAPEDLAASDQARLAMLAGESSTYSAEKRCRRRDGSELWIHLNTTLVRDARGEPAYFITVIERITQRKQSEIRLQRLNRLYSVLRRIGEAIVVTTDRQQLYAAACRIAVESGGLRLVVVAEVDAATGEVYPAASAGVGVEYAQELTVKMHGERSLGTIGTALHTGRHDVCNDIDNDPRMLPWQPGAQQWGFRATASFPLKIGDVVIGALVLFATEVEYFQDDEVDLMVAIASELSYALESLEKASQREVAQAALRASESSLIEAQRIARLGNWQWDIASNQLRWSQEIYRNLGLPLGSFADVLSTQAFFDSVHADDRSSVRASLARSLESGAPCEFEYRVILASGEERSIHTRGQVFLDESGKAVRIAGTAQDVSERRAAEERLRRSEELLRIAGDTARIGGWSFDIATRRLTLSDVVCAIRELPPGTVLSIDTALGLYAPEWVDTIAIAFRRCLEDGTPYDLEVEILTSTGRRTWVRTMGEAVRAANGAVVRIQGAFQDISERKRSEAQMLRLVDRLTTTLESITDAFFTIDTEWRFTYVNPEAERLLHHSRLQLLGMNVWELFPEAIGSTSELEYRRAVAERCTVEFEHRYEPLNLWAEVRAYPSDEGLAVYFRDVTESRLAALEAQRAEQTRIALVQIQEELSAPSLSLQAAMTLVAIRTRALTEACGCAVELVEGSELVYRAATGTLAQHIGMRTALADSLSPAVLTGGKVLHCSDAETNVQVNLAACRKIGVRSLIVAPLRIGETVSGVIEVVSERAGAFTAREVANLQTLSESFSTILQRHRDAIALRESEAQYRLLFNSNPHPMWVYDIATLAFVAVNDAAIEHYGYSAEEFQAMSIRDIRAPQQVTQLEKLLSTSIDGKRRLGIWQHRRKDGSTIDVEITSDRIVFNGQMARLVLAHDITERLRAERELSRVSRAQRLLSRCIEAQVRATDESTLLGEICQIAVDVGGYRMAWVGYAHNDAAHTITPVAQAGDEAGYLSDITLTWSEGVPTGMGPGGRTIRSGRATVATDITIESAQFHWHARAVECGYRGVICLPLRDAERTFGLLGLYMAEVQSVSDEEIELLQQLADDLAFGINNLRSQHERKLLQNALMKVAAGVSAGTGTAFFEQLTRSMTEAVAADCGYVVRLDSVTPGLASSIMAVDNGAVVANFDYQIEGTPCASLLHLGQCVVPDQVADQYPGDPMLRDMAVQAYVGRRLDNSQGRPIGLLYVLYRRPLERTQFVTSTLKIFAARAAAELERLESDAHIREQASLLDQAQDAIVVHRVPGHEIVYWNQGARRLYGWTADEALGRPMDKLLQISPAEARTPMQCVLDRGEWNGEFNERRKDGSAIVAEVRCTLVRDTNEQPRSILSIMSDITERRRAEERLQQALSDLNSRNRELQDFAFVASHDLQEPLRKIRAFSDRLISRLAPALDEQARDYLQRSAAAAARMQTLIDDLLEYSRIDSRGKSFVVVELGPLLATVIEDLYERIESSGARIDVGIMPALEGDYTQLRQLFQNLLSNSLKFRHPERAPQIRVEAEPARTEQGRPAYRIVIKDNGIGFDFKHAARIFVPFQRLHSRENYEGTGIGLAIVRRIVERHRGQIEVTDASDSGVTFSILLPQWQRHTEPVAEQS